ncbi:WD40 domain containing protein [Pyrrhoderma noxium]|uniref:WD40 domain containing protein n=1 Tax=Pyrrhoderma noxium TaxID=2282107 RepID=A0A286UWC5_9AGAM|nr:WD40 domain containing protein [Pyrrhoderma noxium]
MVHSDSDDDNEVNDGFDFDGRSSEADEGLNEDDLFDADDGVDDASEHGEESLSEDEEDDEGDEDEDDDESQEVRRENIPLQASLHAPPQAIPPQPSDNIKRSSRESTPQERESYSPRSYTVEAICAIAHPEPTHALATSLCTSHLLTGSEDGYIRDYDVFASVNGKTFLTAPQRQHCGVVEGTMKAGHLRMWWENPGVPVSDSVIEDHTRSSVTSLAMHSDALWALGGTEKGHINLFTVRHEPGQCITSLSGHRGHVSSLALQHDQMGFFSAGWDGDVYQWDLNTGHQVRKYTSTGAQVAVVAVRPLVPVLPPPSESQAGTNSQEDDTKSDASYDPLFDEPEEEDHAALPPAKPNVQATSTAPLARPAATYPRGPPVLDSVSYGTFSPDVLMTASIDGSIVLWDQRVNTPGKGVGRLEMSNKTPPWCVSACWSADGGQIYAGRRNSTVDVWDTRQFGQSVNGVPKLLKTLRNPISSGAVSCVAAFPDGRHIAVASNDNIRLWNANEAGEKEAPGRGRSGVPFKIIPGHHGGIISQMVIDPAARFMVTASSNRGWSGESTRVVLIHDIKHVV